jgi:hypothetical protein
MARRRSVSHRRRLSLVALIALLFAAACAPGGTTGDASSSPASSLSTAAAPSPTGTEPAAPSPSNEPSAVPTAADPVAWRQLEPAGSTPPAREDGTWTEDPGGRTAYLFGGRDGTAIFDDLWAYELDGDRWTELAPEGDVPPKRFGHEAVWVDGIGVVVFAGQAGPTTFFNDLWAYDPTANRWQALSVEGSRPTARYGTCAAVGPDGRLWISHGFTEDGTRFADTQAFDFGTGRWSDVTPDGQAPVNRCLHGCWWTDDGRFALYAGQTTGVDALGDLWTLAEADTPAAAWTRATGELPPDRNLYAFARHGDVMVIVGGRGLGSAFLDDAFTIDTTTLAIEPLDPEGPTPPGRGGAMLIDDAARGRVVLFGGKTADDSLGDLWELSLP